MSRRPTSKLFIALPAVTAAAALLLTACSNDKGGGETEEGPLSEYLSALWDGEEFTQEVFDEQQKQIEDLVAVCMQEEGFEYQPNVQNGGVVMSSDDSEIEWGSEEFAKQYGYGMIDFPGREEMENQDPNEYVDPNQDYISSLSESEQQAFYETLYGPSPTEEEMLEMEEDGGGYSPDWTEMGCYGAAQHEVNEESNSAMNAYEDPEFAELFEEMNAVWNVIYDESGKHEDVVKIEREWTDCMNDAGFSEYTSPNDANTKISEEMNELYTSGEGEEWVEPSKDDLDKFKEHEIEVAVADFQCREKVGYDDEIQRITFDLEQKFVDEHKAELDALLAKYATASKKG